MRTVPRLSAPLPLALVMFALFVLAIVPATSAMDKYVAIAVVEAPNGDRLETPIQIVVDRLTTVEERAALIEAVQAGGTESARAILEKAPDIGSIEFHDRRAMLKFAYVQTVDAESILTVLTSVPMAFVGSRQPEAKPVAGYDLAIATLYLDNSGRGRGELSPAAKVKVRDNGLITVLDYADKLVELHGVERKPE